MTSRDTIDSTAHRLLGDETITPDQRRAVEEALERDTLVVLPTGSGKSLVYQVTAALMGGLTVVVSPTLSLQADQLASLTEAGVPAALVNGTVRASRRERIFRDAAEGRLAVLLLTPEQATDDDVIDELAAADVRLVVVDEAHCVSTWGTDFRPDYLALGGVVERLGRPRVLALTATAPPRTRRAVAAALGSLDMAVVVGNADRPEIHLSGRVTADADATESALAELLDERTGQDGATLVYAATRRRVDELHQRLTEAGREVDRYHGGMRVKERDDVLRRFRAGEARLVVATSAFGLGIDRSDVRLVVHVDPPESLDELWQEIGRAGRDGEAAAAVILSRPDGYGLRRFFAASAGASDEDLGAVVAALGRLDRPVRPSEVAEAAGLTTRRSRAALNVLQRTGAVDEGRRGVRLVSQAKRREVVAAARELQDDLRALKESEVELVRRYAETDDCRRRLVLELLGEEHPEQCGRCDSCDAGTSTTVTRRPFALGAAVTHETYGAGRVAQYEDDRIVVLFESEGYRTLDLDLVESKDLLVAD